MNLRGALLILALAAAAVAASAGSASATINWRQAAGATIQVSLNQHPYAQGIIDRLNAFQEKTGIQVRYTVTPEEGYFDKVTTALFAKSGTPDVFMSGVYQMWDYASLGYMEALDPYLGDPRLTDGNDYDLADFVPGVLASGRWSLRVGDPVGSGAQYLLPLGWEGYCLTYNKKALADRGLQPPRTLQELAETGAKLKGWNGPGSFGVAVRGTLSWATIHPGYMTLFASRGAKDFVVRDGRLACALDSPASVEVTDGFAQLVRRAGPPDWPDYTWYRVKSSVGTGKAAIMLDATCAGFFAGVKDGSPLAGSLGYAPPPTAREGDPLKSNLWVWALGMNHASRHKTAAWLFIQYFTGKEHERWGAVEGKVVDPARRSVLESPEFARRMEADCPGYLEMIKQVSPVVAIQFSPQPFFFQTTTVWAATLQDIVLKNLPAKEAMGRLTQETNQSSARVKMK